MAELLHCLGAAQYESLVPPSLACADDSQSGLFPQSLEHDTNCGEECDKALQERNEELEQQVAMLQQDRRERKEEELGLRKQLSELYAGENAHFRSWKDQVDRMSGYEREIIRLKGDLWLAEHNNEVLKQSLEKYEDVSKALKTLQKKFNELQVARDHYSNEARELHADCRKLHEENENQSREIADLQRQVDEWKSVAMRVTDLLPQQPSDDDTPVSAEVQAYQSGKKRRIPGWAAAPSSATRASVERKK